VIDTTALREKVLDLAIRGKLVPQDPNDEPASVLLERIREQKKQMVKEGKLKAKDIKDDSIIYKEDNCYYEKFNDGTIKNIQKNIPFELPLGWSWERLGNVCSIARGGSPRPIEEYLTTDSNGINWIKIGDTEKDGKYILKTKEKILPTGLYKSRYVKSGDFLLTNSMSFGRPYILKTDGCIHDGWLVIGETDKVFYQDFLYYMLSSTFMYKSMSGLAAGSTVKNLKSESVKSLLIPIPSINEQKRISSKLEECIKLLDIINISKQEIIKIKDNIKERILCLAIQGKLVEQDPNDEPASILLEKIREERKTILGKKYVDSYIYKADDNCYYEKITENKECINEFLPFDLPDGWEYTRLENILDYEQPTDYIVKSTNYNNNFSTPVLTAGKSFIIGYTNETNGIKKALPVIIFDDFTTESKYVDFPFKVKSSAMKILFTYNKFINLKFLYYVMQTICCNHDNHKRYWISEYSKFIIALPPLKEQNLIVNKIEYLFSLIN